MKIYTLFYSDTGLYNHNIFVCPNDETAIKAMNLNLMDSKAERFRNEVNEGNVVLTALALFDEEKGAESFRTPVHVCNLKDLLFKQLQKQKEKENE